MLRNNKAIVKVQPLILVNIYSILWCDRVPTVPGIRERKRPPGWEKSFWGDKWIELKVNQVATHVLKADWLAGSVTSRSNFSGLDDPD